MQNKSTIIKKRAFPELPKERCNYCLNLTKELEKEKPFWQFAYRLEDEKMGLWLMSQSPYPKIRKKIDDCKFPYCKGECSDER
jgi:hypothetical protein